jgi:hypothetical protein
MTTQTEETRIDVHASSGIRTQGPSVRAGEDFHALDRAASVIGTLLSFL